MDKNIEHDLLNVGSGEEISIKDLALRIKNLVDYEGDISFDLSKPDGNPRKLIDSSKMNELGWEAKTDLDEGLKITYDWFLDNK